MQTCESKDTNRNVLKAGLWRYIEKYFKDILKRYFESRSLKIFWKPFSDKLLSLQVQTHTHKLTIDAFDFMYKMFFSGQRSNKIYVWGLIWL